jgi:uncharacterized membrane protein
MNDLGRRVFGVAAIWLGLVGLAFADFAAVWQPVPAGLPGRTALAYATAVVLLASGAALQWRRTAKPAAIVLAVLYAAFALLWARRIVTHPQIFGVWSGTAEQLALVVGGAVAWAWLQPSERTAQAGRLVFGLCLVAFGVAHVLYVKETAALVPAWLPPGPKAWAYVTGACHVLAGLALLSGLQALLAARLLTAMFVGFGLLVWLPQLLAKPGDHMAWAGNGVNLALVGAAWVVADAIARFGAPGLSGLRQRPA